MNNELYQQAKVAAMSKDYNSALELYSACLQDDANPLEPGESGLIYHQIGNCLVKAKSYYEAVEAYKLSAADSDYDEVGVVNCNLGMSYAALKDWPNAVKHFEIAVSDANYSTPYKVHMGMGNALLKQGKSAEAGVAFREAALDEANPNPPKALLNLGVCFMALNRPEDAVASYESALQFDNESDLQNRLYSSLGQAYAASDKMSEAVEAFEKALEDKTYFLSDSASVDYQRAIAAVSHGSADSTQILPPVNDTSGLDVASDGSTLSENESYVDEENVSEDYYFADEFSKDENKKDGEEHFFNSSDEELDQWSNDMVKLERKRKSVGLKILVVIILLLLALLGTGLFLYTQGFGFPTQETCIDQMFKDPKAASNYAKGVSQSDIADIEAIVSPGTTVKIDGINKTMSASKAYVTGTTPQGGEVRYEVSLVRDFIGWKVSDVDLYFASTDKNAK